uniref:Uncharacterized protein n=1 Tax=Escherichia coli TaxID=562 RepID=I3VZX1_ECOLX|nr:hypothetical protein [Escherichia coli]
MFSKGMNAASAGFQVGNESPSQKVFLSGSWDVRVGRRFHHYL